MIISFLITEWSIFVKLWYSFTKGCLVPSLVEIVPVVLGKKILISSMYFCYFVIISPWKRAQPFIWTNFNPLYQRMICAKFRWNWHRGSREEDFFFNLNFKILSMYFHYFVIVSPWKMVWSFIWKKLNSLHKDALYEVWLKCPSCSWEKDAKFRQCSFAMLKYLPL